MLLILPQRDEFGVKNRSKRQLQRFGSQFSRNIKGRMIHCLDTEPCVYACEKLVKAAGLPAHQINHIKLNSIAAKKWDWQHRLLVIDAVSVPHFLSDELLFEAGNNAAKNILILRHGRTKSIFADACQIINAGDLPKGCPFPNSNGVEIRKRPPYYYNQSGVLPLCLDNGQIRVLLVSSSKNKHWGIPKGIVEPGLTPAQSALNEAFEEAGVEGQCLSPLGLYRYQKWGAECRVLMFAMQVQRTLAHSNWLENHRRRLWCPLSNAIGLVHNLALKSFLADLHEQQLRHIVGAG